MCVSKEYCRDALNQGYVRCTNAFVAYVHMYNVRSQRYNDLICNNNGNDIQREKSY